MTSLKKSTCHSGRPPRNPPAAPTRPLKKFTIRSGHLHPKHHRNHRHRLPAGCTLRGHRKTSPQLTHGQISTPKSDTATLKQVWSTATPPQSPPPIRDTNVLNLVTCPRTEGGQIELDISILHDLQEIHRKEDLSLENHSPRPPLSKPHSEDIRILPGLHLHHRCQDVWCKNRLKTAGTPHPQNTSLAQLPPHYHQHTTTTTINTKVSQHRPVEWKENGQ